MGARPSKGPAMDGAAACSSPTNEAATTTTCSLWSDLPPELAGLVLGRLPSHEDHIRFSFVCRHWRHGAREWSSPAPPALLPWHNFMDREVTFQSLRSGKLHIRMPGIPDNGICLGSSDNWLMFFKLDEHRRPRCFLKNPFSGAILTLPERYHNEQQSEHDYSPWRVPYIHNFIVCSSSDLVIASGQTNDGPATIACCRPGRSSSWSVRSYIDATKKEYCHRHRYQGIVFHRGKLYCVNWRGDLFAHEVIISCCDEGGDNYNHPTLSPSKNVIDGMFHFAKLYLMASSCTGKLLVVQRIGVTAPVSFQVFEADLETSRWKKMESLDDDEVLFVSAKFSKTVSAATSHGGYGLRRNHIYFLDCGDYTCTAARCGTYDLSNHTFHLIPSDCIRDDGTTPAWFFPCPSDTS